MWLFLGWDGVRFGLLQGMLALLAFFGIMISTEERYALLQTRPS